MTTASKRFLHPDVVARISSLELRAREIVEGLITGRHRSPYRGHSVEFAQHREYVPGDDYRHIDWKVWAKSNRLYVKEYEEETNLRTTLLLDVSESMAYGKGPTSKYEYACCAAAALAYLLLHQADIVGMVAFDDDIRHEVPHRSSPTHLASMLHAMHVDQPKQLSDLGHVLARITERDPKRGLMVLLSDLLAEPESVLRGLRLLRQRRHDVVVLHLLHDDELDFPFEGHTRFEGMELPNSVTCDPRSLRTGYLEALERYLDTLKRQCSLSGIDYRLVRTSQPVEAVLASLLHERTRR